MAKPSKTPLIEQFINANATKVYSTKELCSAIGVSLPTLIKYINSNPNRFTLVQYGVYEINQVGQHTVSSQA